MANVLKFSYGGVDVDLLAAAASGLHVQKWLPGMPAGVYRDMPPYITESMDILADRASDDNLASTLQALDAARHWADIYRQDKTVREPVWLHAKMADETGERRAHVRSIAGSWRSDQIAAAGEAVAHDALLRLEVVRHPFWERTAYVDGHALANQTGASIMFDYTNGGAIPVVGDVPARCIRFQIGTSTSDIELDRIWAGFRSTKFGTPANFKHIWELEDTDALAGTDCSAPQADGTASPGGGGNTRREVTFATTPGWANRLTIALDDITADYADNFGRSLWLLRCRVGSATECEVQLRWGYEYAFEVLASPGYVASPIRAVSNSDWDYYEMGQQCIPPINAQVDPGRFSTASISRDSAVQVWARRTSGSGSLYLDCLCLVPLDEGWLIVKNLRTAVVTNDLCYSQTPEDHDVCWHGSMSTPIETYRAEWSAQDFRFPVGDGRLIIVHARSDQSVLTDPRNIWTAWTPRWSNLRGSE